MTPALVGPLLAVAWAATPTPSPEPVAGSGPGILGFLVTFALVVVCIPLFLSMTRKVRGVRFRDEDGGPAAGSGFAAPEAAAPGGAPRDAQETPEPRG